MKPRHDCEYCHGTGLMRHQRVGERLPKDGLAPLRPCLCRQRQTVPLTGPRGRRQIMPFPVEYKGREGKGRKELRKHERRK